MHLVTGNIKLYFPFTLLGPRLNILEKEANYLIEFLAMNQESINLLTSVVTDSATQSQIDDFVSELRSGAY